MARNIKWATHPKEISIDGGESFADADDPEDMDVPTVVAPSGAEYRLIVENCGNVGLENVVINDSTLGLNDVAIGDLDVDETRTLTSGDTDFGNLNQPERCPNPGAFENVAEVVGDSVETDDIVSDTDPANLTCAPPPPVCRLEVDKSVDPDTIVIRRGDGDKDKDKYKYKYKDKDRDACPRDEVTYTYRVTNQGSDVLGITLVDDQLGEIASDFDLLAGARRTFTERECISETTTNTVVAEGSLEIGEVCSATDEATVTVRRDKGKDRDKDRDRDRDKDDDDDD